jgi:hypothetical protein
LRKSRGKGCNAALACAFEADTARHSAPLRFELAIPFQAAWHVHQEYGKHFPVGTGTHDARGQTHDGTHSRRHRWGLYRSTGSELVNTLVQRLDCLSKQKVSFDPA